MKINKQLFKEAYKQGYKKAKSLNEDTAGDEYKNKRLFSKLLAIKRGGTDVRIFVDFTAGRGISGECYYWTVGGNPERLIIETRDDYSTQLFEKDIVGALRKKDHICINFNDKLKTSLSIYFYKRLQMKEIDSFNDLPSPPRFKDYYKDHDWTVLS